LPLARCRAGLTSTSGSGGRSLSVHGNSPEASPCSAELVDRQQDQDGQGDGGQGGGEDPGGGVGREGVAGAHGPVGGQEAAVATPGGGGTEEDQDTADQLATAGDAQLRGEADHPEAGHVKGQGGPHPGQQGPLVGKGEAVVRQL